MLRRVSKRRELSTAVGLTLSLRVYRRHFDHALRGPDAVEVLRHLRRQVGRAIIVIWDRLNAHRSPEVRAYLAEHPDVMVDWLPPYAPDLNPEEDCHGNVKQRLRNATPATVEELRAQADLGFRRLRRRPDLLAAFFRHVGIRVKQIT